LQAHPLQPPVQHEMRVLLPCGRLWLTEKLAANGNPIRQMPIGLPLGHRARSNCHLLAMHPDPSSRTIIVAFVAHELTQHYPAYQGRGICLGSPPRYSVIIGTSQGGGIPIDGENHGT
jgi:hypothetical protein